MSTHNIPGLQPGRNSLGRIARAVSTRATAVREALEAYDVEEENVRVGAAALLQSIDDERAPLAEEGEQLLAILEAGRRPATAPAPTPAPLPAPPVVVQQPNPAPIVVATPEPEPAPVAPATTSVTTTTTTPTVHVARPNWGVAAWIAAIICGLAGLLIGANTREWIGDLADLHSGFGPWVLKALWIVGVTATGFYAGGFITSAVTNRARPITGP